MKVKATSNKKKEVFKPIEVAVTIIIEKESEIEDLKYILREINEGNIRLEDYDGDDYSSLLNIITEVAKQL